MKFVRETRIAAPPEAVFACHEQPGALAALVPPWEKVTVEGGGSLKPGTRVNLATRLGPIPLKWVAEHVGYDPPRSFSDRQVSGPFKRWEHSHQFLDDGRGGTILHDEVDYEIPFGWIGRILGGGLVRRKLDRMFAFRHETTRAMVEAGVGPTSKGPIQ